MKYYTLDPIYPDGHFLGNTIGPEMDEDTTFGVLRSFLTANPNEWQIRDILRIEIRRVR